MIRVQNVHFYELMPSHSLSVMNPHHNSIFTILKKNLCSPELHHNYKHQLATQRPQIGVRVKPRCLYKEFFQSQIQEHISEGERLYSPTDFRNYCLALTQKLQKKNCLSLKGFLMQLI